MDDYVSSASPVRAIDAFVDSLDLPAPGFKTRNDCSEGRSSYHPGSLLKLYLRGYLKRTRSSRGLVIEKSDSLFSRLGRRPSSPATTRLPLDALNFPPLNLESAVQTADSRKLLVICYWLKGFLHRSQGILPRPRHHPTGEAGEFGRKCLTNQ